MTYICKVNEGQKRRYSTDEVARWTVRSELTTKKSTRTMTTNHGTGDVSNNLTFESQMCNTDQNYVGGDSHATPTEQTVNSGPQVAPQAHKAQRDYNGKPMSLWFGDESEVGRHTVTTLSAFGGMMTHPNEVNRLRQDIRAWFSAYIPKWEESFSECDLDESIAHYEALDNFLSALVAEGIDNLMSEGGRGHE